ncbi:hypothetical protein ACQ4PT_060792 [Festuca glaucescens]
MASSLPHSAATAGAASRRRCCSPLSDAAGAPLSSPMELEDDGPAAAGAASRRRCWNLLSAGAGGPLSPPLELDPEGPVVEAGGGVGGLVQVGDLAVVAVEDLQVAVVHGEPVQMQVQDRGKGDETTLEHDRGKDDETMLEQDRGKDDETMLEQDRGKGDETMLEKDRGKGDETILEQDRGKGDEMMLEQDRGKGDETMLEQERGKELRDEERYGAYFALEDLKYDLYGVVKHSGLPNFGHYVCTIRSSPTSWHLMNDTLVDSITETSALNQEAYLLFYVRQGMFPWFSSFLQEANSGAHSATKRMYPVNDHNVFAFDNLAQSKLLEKMA